MARRHRVLLEIYGYGFGRNSIFNVKSQDSSTENISFSVLKIGFSINDLMK